MDTAIANLKRGIRLAKGRPNMIFAVRWKKRMGWQHNAVNTAGVHLTYDDPIMKESRAKHHLKVNEKNLDQRLLLNVDQLWRSAYRPKKKTLWKPRKKIGTPASPKVSARKRQVQRFSDNLNMVDNTERVGNRRCQTQKKKPSANNSTKRRRRTWDDAKQEDIRLDPVKKYRSSLTVCTSMWGNGEAGPLGINVSEGIVSPCLRKKFNEEWKGRAYIMYSGTRSHYMNSETTLELWEELFTPVSNLNVTQSLYRAICLLCCNHVRVTLGDPHAAGETINSF